MNLKENKRQPTDRKLDEKRKDVKNSAITRGVVRRWVAISETGGNSKKRGSQRSLCDTGLERAEGNSEGVKQSIDLKPHTAWGKWILKGGKSENRANFDEMLCS